jgi:Reverse transcriptase (RNA-dependent DNA polymerase)
MGTVRILVSCVAHFNWPLHQLDVNNVFLHGDLKEEVYIEVLLGFVTPQSAGKVRKLKKSLYGLKQSPRAWFDRFRLAVCGMEYKQCSEDHTIFYKHSRYHITILVVYVDDIVITGDEEEEILLLKRRSREEFEVKDIGQLKYFGIEIIRLIKGIVLLQWKYVLDFLSVTGC